MARARSRWWTALAACALIGGGGCGGSSAPSSSVDAPYRTFIAEGMRSGWLFLPSRYAGADSVPLVVDLHGYGGTAEGHRTVSGYYELFDDPADGFAIVYPQGVGNSWNAGPTCCGLAVTENLDDVGALVEMVHAILREWPKIDAGRVYVTGLSNGAAMAQRLGVEASETFAAGAGYAQRLLVAAPATPLPFAYIDFAGYQDPVVPYGGSATLPSVEANIATWRRLDGCSEAARTEDLGAGRCVHYEACSGGVEVVSCGFDGGHVIYQNAGGHDLARMGWEFMKRFRR